VTRRARGDRGEALTAALMFTAMLAFWFLVVFAGRLSTSRNEVLAAARAGARAASQERDPGVAYDRAVSVARGMLSEGSSPCESADVTPDTSGWAPGGIVRVTVTCHVRRGDLGLIGLGGTMAVTESAVSVLDTYRSPG